MICRFGCFACFLIFFELQADILCFYLLDYLVRELGESVCFQLKGFLVTRQIHNQTSNFLSFSCCSPLGLLTY